MLAKRKLWCAGNVKCGSWSLASPSGNRSKFPERRAPKNRDHLIRSFPQQVKPDLNRLVQRKLRLEHGICALDPTYLS